MNREEREFYVKSPLSKPFFELEIKYSDFFRNKSIEDYIIFRINDIKPEHSFGKEYPTSHLVRYTITISQELPDHIGKEMLDIVKQNELPLA
jgi:hypothetical protein